MKGLRFFQTVQFKLILIYVLLILIAVQLIGVYFFRALEIHFQNNFSDSLNKQAYLLAKYVEPYLSSQAGGTPEEVQERYADLDDVVTNLNTIGKAEIQVIDANGVVLSASLQSDRSKIGQKNTQTEVTRALQGIKVNEKTVIDARGVRNKVIAMQVGEGGKVLGAIYIVASMEDLYATINRINRIFFSGTLIALVLTAVLGIILSNTITHPIKELTKQAKDLAEGKFRRQVKAVGWNDEIGQLAGAFNYMADRLKEALSLNEEEKEKLSSVLTNMNDGVIATDEAGKVMLLNRRAKQMLRVQEADVANQPISLLLGLSESQIEMHVRGTSDENATTIELEQDYRDKNRRVRVTFTPIHRRGEGIKGTIAVLQDVTEQEELDEARREFVANVSHELRTPLTTIKSYLEALDDGALDEPELARRFVGVTRNETERMIRLVTDLLHLSRLDSKQAMIAKEWVHMETMLEDLADRFAFQLRQRGMTIHMNVEKGLPDVLLDADQIDQVLDNLVSNSVKYTPDGGFIEISAARDEQSLAISVRDSGIGIPKKDIQRIFDRFYRVDKARSRNMGGTGLGLSIAREIIKAHGGTISLDSEMNQGTTVSFTLPLGSKERELG